jgi:hypothetical protein
VVLVKSILSIIINSILPKQIVAESIKHDFDEQGFSVQVSGVSLWPEGPNFGLETYRQQAFRERFQISIDIQWPET